MYEKERYYKCPASVYTAARLNLIGVEFQNKENDSIAIHDNASLCSELESYLACQQPLQACSYCLGTAGFEIPCQQLDKEAARAELTEDHSDIKSLLDPEPILPSAYFSQD